MIFNYFKTKREEKAKKSLALKLQVMIHQFAWIETNFSLTRTVDFFYLIEKEMDSITEKEWEVAPTPLKNVLNTTGRDKYGWFRAPVGSSPTMENTFIQPTNHYDEFFYTHSISELMSFKDKPSDQGGFAKEPMTIAEFYANAFVYPFTRDKYAALKSALKNLS